MTTNLSRLGMGVALAVLTSLTAACGGDKPAAPRSTSGATPVEAPAAESATKDADSALEALLASGACLERSGDTAEYDLAGEDAKYVPAKLPSLNPERALGCGTRYGEIAIAQFADEDARDEAAPNLSDPAQPPTAYLAPAGSPLLITARDSTALERVPTDTFGEMQR